MGKIRIARSDAGLRRASMAVDYDVSMLGTTMHLLLDSKVTMDSSPEEWVRFNSLLHAFLLAARNLAHFLYSHSPHSQDVIAEDFFDVECDWPRIRPEPRAEIKDGTLVKRISQRLCHITWERASETKPTWAVFPITWGLAKPLEQFVIDAPAARIDERLREDVDALLAVMRTAIDTYGAPEDVESSPLGALLDEGDIRLYTTLG